MVIVTHNLPPVYASIASPASAIASGAAVTYFKTFVSKQGITAHAKDALLNKLVSMDRFRMILPGMTLVALASVISTMTTLLATTNQFQDMIANPNPANSDPPAIYDFIVVGAGSAGGIVANRLSESGLHKVLLLEAGGDPLSFNEIPFLYPSNLNKPETDWGYKTVPQKFAGFGVVNNSLPFPRGKSVGGSSNLNAMLYMRGCPKDFDNWAHLTGDNQWTYDNVLPYFKKFERYEGVFKADKVHHSQEGKIYITSPSYQPLYQEWIDAGRELGFPFADPNARQIQSFGPLELFVGEGIRWETYQGYIKPALKRHNFHLIRHAHVLKINLNELSEATGVTYIRNGQVIEVKATTEVILSAGAIGSPQLLMLSGIGSPSELTALGITPKVNLPAVGKGLMDHPASLVGPFLHNDTTSFIVERDFTYGAVLKYMIEKTGPMAGLLTSGQAMLSTRGDPNWPDVAAFHYVNGLSVSSADSLINSFGLKDGTIQKFLEGLGSQDGSWVVISLGLPKSVGQIKLASSNPMDAPLIDPNYYSDSEGADLKAMVKAFKLLVNLHEKTEAFRKYNTTFLRRPFPGCDEFYGDSDKDFECRVKTLTFTTYHPSGTCRMGKPNDPSAVLDSHLRVKGVNRLRVVDASVMPQITNANLNAPVMMIAEKAADLILSDCCSVYKLIGRK